MMKKTTDKKYSAAIVLSAPMVAFSIISLFVRFGNTVFLSVINTAFCALAIAFVCATWGNSYKSANITAVIFAVIQLAFGFTPSLKAQSLAFLVLTLACVGYVSVMLICKIKAGDVITVLIIIPLFTIVHLLKLAMAMTYEGNMPFLIPSVVICGLSGIASFVHCIVKKKKFFSALGWLLITALLVFGMLLILVSTLNYTLDRSEPQQFASVIEKKEIDFRRKGPNDYKFKFNVKENKITLSVPKEDYNRYDEGDYYYFVRYEGAFSPFYMSNGYVK